jgi:hypothetical protein
MNLRCMLNFCTISSMMAGGIECGSEHVEKF